jgi:hypothetical protein
VPKEVATGIDELEGETTGRASSLASRLAVPSRPWKAPPRLRVHEYGGPPNAVGCWLLAVSHSVTTAASTGGDKKKRRRMMEGSSKVTGISASVVSTPPQCENGRLCVTAPPPWIGKENHCCRAGVFAGGGRFTIGVGSVYDGRPVMYTSSCNNKSSWAIGGAAAVQPAQKQ